MTHDPHLVPVPSCPSRPVASLDARPRRPLLVALVLPFVMLAIACGSSTGQGPAAAGGAAGGSSGSIGSGGTAVGGGTGKGGTAGLGSAGGPGDAGGGLGGTVTGGTAGHGSAGAAGTAGATGGGAGGATGAGGAGGTSSSSCASATAGAACASEGATCGGPCTDICQFCNLLRCSGGHWQGSEAAPAPCFACGTGKCQTLKQYCQTTEGGPAETPPRYACLDIPAECLSNRTCTCLGQQHVGGSCTMGANGELMTLLAVP